MKGCIRILILSLLTALIAGCCGLPPETTTTTIVKSTTTVVTTRIVTTTLMVPQDKISCESAGGIWGRIGLSPKESCNLPTKDGGKECSSQSDCEGACLAELTPEQTEKLANQEVVETTGKCTERIITVGCRAFVEDGKVEHILCID